MHLLRPLSSLLLTTALFGLLLPTTSRAANPPQLFSVSVTPGSADVGAADQPITVTLRVTAVDGLTSGSAALQLASGTGNSSAIQLGANTRVSGDQFDGTYSAAAIIPRGSTAGTYLLHVALTSGSSSTDYHQNSVWPGGAQPSITITNTPPDNRPVLQSMDISPAAIDVTTADQTVTYTFRVTTPDGLKSIQTFNASGADYFGPVQLSGDANDGVYQFTRTFPHGFPSQTDVPYIRFQGTSSTRIYSSSTPASDWPGGVVPALTITDSLPDTSAPVLVASSITPGAPAPYDLSGGDVTAVLTLHITDDVRGFTSGTILYWPDEDTIHQIRYLPISFIRTQPPQPPMTLTVRISDADRISGTPQDGIYQKQFTVPKYLLSTVWLPVSLSLSDGFHTGGANGLDYVDGHFAPISTPGGIYFGVTNSQPDFVAPTLTSASVNPAVIGTSLNPTPITLTTTLTDDSLGFASATGVLRNAHGDEIPVTIASSDLTSGTPQNGTYTTTVTVPAGTPLGVYDLVLSVTDGAYTARATKTAVLAIDNDAPHIGVLGFYDWNGSQQLLPQISLDGTQGSFAYVGATITDDALGFVSATGVFTHSSGATLAVNITPTSGPLYLANRPDLPNLYFGQVDLPAASPAGDWVLTSLTLSDGTHSSVYQTGSPLLTIHVSNQVTISVGAVQSATSNEATVHQILYPNGAGPFTLAFAYGVGAFDQSTDPVSYPRSTDPLDAQVVIGSLLPNRTYQARSVVTGAWGTQYGETFTFTTPPDTPPVPDSSTTDDTGTHISVTFTDADLGSQAYIEYGPTNSYGSATTPVTIMETGSQSLPLGTLPPHSSYVYRLVLKNSAGTSYGAEQTLAIGNHTPVAPSLTGSFHGTTPAQINLAATITDADGDTLTVSTVTGATHGSASVVNNQVLYQSDGTSQASETLSYTVVDGFGGSAQGTLTLASQNHSPIAANLHFTRGNLTEIVIDPLATASDADQDTISLVSFTQPANGSVRTESAHLLYTSNGRQAGVDRFTYKISDGLGGEATGTVDIVSTENGSGLTYNGLLHAPGAPAQESIGYLSLRTLARQSYTGVLLFGGERLPFSGKLASGAQQKALHSAKAGRLTLDFTLDGAAEQFSGTLSYGSAGATVSAPFAFGPVDALSHLPSARYTAAFGPPSSGPFYAGYAAISSAANGNTVRVVGKLSDGSAISASGGLVNHALPLYAILKPTRPTKPGTFSGELAFQDSPDDGHAITGSLSLLPAVIGRAAANAPTPPTSYLLSVQGSTYVADRTAPPLDLPSATGMAAAQGSDFTHSWSIRLAAPNHITTTGTDAKMLSLTFDLSTGVFHGTIAAAKGHRYPVAGVVLRDSHYGFGYFQAPDSGTFTINEVGLDQSN